jgi:5-methylcytosine-specific restriction endonuclease McrA
MRVDVVKLTTMGYLFVPLYDYDREGKRWRKLAWIGPEQSLRSEPRRALSAGSKRELLSRQKNRCRFCESRITLEPYCNADADHIIPINYGGKTSLENMQLLCVGCHRHKTSLENAKEKRIVHLAKDSVRPGETMIVYSSRPEIKRPMDMRNPVDIVTPHGSESRSETSHVLKYRKRRTGIRLDPGSDGGSGATSVNIFDEFRYMG